jgi:DNA repair protein RecO (recombination protein O)
MSLVVTEAIVLHAFDYLESSRILRLVTRDAGVRSVLARGARRSRTRFGTALDLYAQGMAELHVKPGRDLDTLASFDVARARPQLAGELARFTGASAIAELTLRFTRDAADPALFAAVAEALDTIGAATAHSAREATLLGAWRVLAELGVAPVVDFCAECHAVIDEAATAMFSHPAGGALCARCGRLARSGRVLPPSARVALRAWLNGERVALSDDAELRAHQRLLREFLHEHLADDRPLRAFDVWEHAAWSSAT